MENFELILDKYNKFGKDLQDTKFFRMFVSEINPKITWDMWYAFIRVFRYNIVVKRDKIIEAAEDNAVTMDLLEERSLKNLLSITNATIDSIINDPGVLNEMPVGKRLDVLFKAMKARDSRVQALVKKRADEREQTAYDELMQDAQYGSMTEEELNNMGKEYEQKSDKQSQHGPEALPSGTEAEGESPGTVPEHPEGA